MSSEGNPLRAFEGVRSMIPLTGAGGISADVLKGVRREVSRDIGVSAKEDRCDAVLECRIRGDLST